MRLNTPGIRVLTTSLTRSDYLASRAFYNNLFSSLFLSSFGVHNAHEGCKDTNVVCTRTVARKSSVGRLLCLRRGTWHSEILRKIYLFIVFNISIWGSKPTKVPPAWWRDWSALLNVQPAHCVSQIRLYETNYCSAIVLSALTDRTLQINSE